MKKAQDKITVLFLVCVAILVSFGILGNFYKGETGAALDGIGEPSTLEKPIDTSTETTQPAIPPEEDTQESVTNQGEENIKKTYICRNTASQQN